MKAIFFITGFTYIRKKDSIMKLNLPFYTPKQHWETYQLMKSVKPQHDYHKMLKERNLYQGIYENIE